MRLVALFLFALLVATSSWADDIPDLNKTPGVVRASLTKARVCAIKWGNDERHVTDSMKEQVFALYGYSGYDDLRCVPAGKRTCEIDHLISREIGGADMVANLWTHAHGTSPWNAVLKTNWRIVCIRRCALAKFL